MATIRPPAFSSAMARAFAGTNTSHSSACSRSVPAFPPHVARRLPLSQLAAYLHALDTMRAEPIPHRILAVPRLQARRPRPTLSASSLPLTLVIRAIVRLMKSVRNGSEADLVSMLPLSIPPAAEFTAAKPKNIHNRKIDLTFQQR